MKTIVVTLLKLALVIGLVYWLIASGKLDFAQLRIFLDRPETLLYNTLIWTCFYVLGGAFRWWILLRGVDLDVSYVKAVRLQLIGFFFNTAMPGSVGGDIVKAIYVIREQRAQRKTPAMLTVLLDRVVGLVGLFVMAGTAVLFNWRFVSHDSALVTLSLVSGGAFAAILIGFAIVFFPFKPGRDPIHRLLSLRVPGFPMVRSIYEALRSYRDKPLHLLATVAISCVIQTAGMLYSVYVTRIVTGIDPDLPTFATIYPLALMTTALPLAPGGLGVGHFAFDRMFSLVGWTGGANVFNITALGQLALNLFGVFPYLMYRAKLPSVGDMQAELSTESA